MPTKTERIEYKGRDIWLSVSTGDLFDEDSRNIGISVRYENSEGVMIPVTMFGEIVKPPFLFKSFRMDVDEKVVNVLNKRVQRAKEMIDKDIGQELSLDEFMDDYLKKHKE